jgi:endonuclease YncB( thermonuclease family)
MLSVLFSLLIASAKGPEKIHLVSATVWRLTYERTSYDIRVFGLAESSQPEIRRLAKIEAQKYIDQFVGLGLDIIRVGPESERPPAVEISYTSWSGDLSFREPNTFTFGEELLRMGLLKIHAQDFNRIQNRAYAGRLAWLQESAKTSGRGMWRGRV